VEHRLTKIIKPITKHDIELFEEIQAKYGLYADSNGQIHAEDESSDADLLIFEYIRDIKREYGKNLWNAYHTTRNLITEHPRDKNDGNFG
jgi:hypothetical protein